MKTNLMGIYGVTVFMNIWLPNLVPFFPPDLLRVIITFWPGNHFTWNSTSTLLSAPLWTYIRGGGRNRRRLHCQTWDWKLFAVFGGLGYSTAMFYTSNSLKPCYCMMDDEAYKSGFPFPSSHIRSSGWKRQYKILLFRYFTN